LETPAPSPTQTPTLELQTNRQASRRDRFTDLIGSGPTSPGIIFFAALVAATLGAFHALEPGHGKTVVAAYLVGSRGTARHAMLLGLIVTASHTAGVYLLGAVPERLYPWLGALSGLTIAVLGFCLFLKRYARPVEHGHSHDASDHDHAHSHDHGDGHHHHDHDHHGHHHHGHHHHHHVPSGTRVSLKELLALGVTGGIVPCPAALVVLLSAVALRRIGFGLFLIVAFSVGLAAVLIGIGLLMVYARRLMARVEGTGPLITRWLPLTSSVTITVLGIAIAAQALINAGVVTIRLG
jgi:ABC-type nickel/cobalt efflux system permease component RcnA